TTSAPPQGRGLVTHTSIWRNWPRDGPRELRRRLSWLIEADDCPSTGSTIATSHLSRRPRVGIVGPITGASTARADGIACVILNDGCAAILPPEVAEAGRRN